MTGPSLNDYWTAGFQRLAQGHLRKTETAAGVEPASLRLDVERLLWSKFTVMFKK